MIDHIPVFQILLQIEVRVSIMASPPAGLILLVYYPLQLTFSSAVL